MESYWSDTVKRISFGQLSQNVEVDVCIIGAGITGISIAYMLSNSDLKICVVDKGTVGGGVTQDTTAKVTSQHGLIYDYLIKTFGYDFAKVYLDSNQDAIERIKNIVKKENIDCDLIEDDSYVYTCKSEFKQKIIDEAEATKRLGLNSQYLENISLPFEIVNSIKFSNQARFHPLKYIFSLAEIISRKNVKIFENSKVIDIKHVENRYNIYTEDNCINAKYIVLATHFPIKNFPGMHFLKMYQDRSYAIAIEQKDNTLHGMYISAESPNMSFRPINNKFLIIGGEGHKTGDNSIDIDKSYKLLEQYAKEVYPNAEIRYRWATQDCVSIDKVPYIGEFSNSLPNIYMATGYKKWGMTTSNVAAKIISDEILNVDSNFINIYNPARFKPIKNHEEFGNILKQTVYSLGINKMKKSKFSIEDIEINNGGVVEYKNEKIVIYKNENGEIFAIKPYCKHLGCELSWNNLEKTWDCPCHGSRYDYKGKLLTEPSTKNLDVIDYKKM